MLIDGGATNGGKNPNKLWHQAYMNNTQGVSEKVATIQNLDSSYRNKKKVPVSIGLQINCYGFNASKVLYKCKNRD